MGSHSCCTIKCNRIPPSWQAEDFRVVSCYTSGTSVEACGTSPADLGHGHAFSLCPAVLSQTAARHGLGDSKAQGLKNNLGAAVGDETVQLYGCRQLQLCLSQGGRWLPALLAHEFSCGQFGQTGPWDSSLPWPAFCAGWSLSCSQDSCTSQISSKGCQGLWVSHCRQLLLGNKTTAPVLTVRGTGARQRLVPSSVKMHCPRNIDVILNRCSRCPENSSLPPSPHLQCAKILLFLLETFSGGVNSRTGIFFNYSWAHTQIIQKVREMRHRRMSGETCCFNKLEMKT